MRKRKSKLYLAILAPLTAIVLSTASIAASGLMAAILIDNEANTFDVTVSGNKYTCYRIQGEGNSDKVAIAWSRDNQLPTDTPDSLTLPKLVSYGGSDYKVASIAPGGFRYCDFSTFNFEQDNLIEDIQEEAFAYCLNLTSIQLPYGIQRISASCFLDCRSLNSVYYSDSGGIKAIYTRRIKEIEDHAFDSCVSLQDITCPRTIEKFGQSSFQRCTSLATFSFSPRILGENDEITNPIEIESYAFADCTGVTKMYFEENLTTVHAYAFADSNESLTFDYTGTKSANQLDTAFGAHWRDKKINNSNTAKYNIRNKQARINIDDLYPGLTYTIETKEEYLNCANANTTTIKPISGSSQYAVITGFTAPTIDVYNDNDEDDIPNYDYYRTTTKTVTLPNELGGKPVKAIKETVFKAKFQDSTKIDKIVFNQNLVQIRHHAFQTCTGFKTLDFSNCTNLIEVSYYAFEGCNNVTRLDLPDCLQYIGDYAFRGLKKAGDLTFGADPVLKTIGERAFQELGESNTSKINLVLPNTLNDADTKTANLYHPDHSDTVYKYTAVGRHAFDKAYGILTVTMAEPTAAQRNNNNYRCSFGTSAFVRCDKLMRFVSSDNLYIIGAGAFKQTNTGFRECYLATKKVAASGIKYPWGTQNTYDADNDVPVDDYKGSLFLQNSHPNLVIYVDGPVPGELDIVDTGMETPPLRWNTESTGAFVNELHYSDSADNSIHINCRSHIPTFYNVDWQAEGNGAKYWYVNSGTVTTTRPDTGADYDSGVVAIVKEKTNDNSERYIIGKYYHENSSKNVIDLTSIPGIDETKIKTIGDGAFAEDNTKDTKNAGLYFVLPSTLEKIGERAFYRRIKTFNNGATRVVTFKSGDVVQAPAGKTWKNDGTGTDFYCMLPSTIKRIERNAFYNNRFKSVDYGGASLEFLGNAAFHCQAAKSEIATVSNLNTANGFELSGNGIYYVGNAAKKTLVLQGGGAAGDLNISAGTKAVGMRAVTNTKYTSVTIPDGLTFIYGGGFQKNALITKVNNGKDLQYIGALKSTLAGDDTVEIYDSSLPFDNIDYRDSLDNRAIPESRYGAFKDCIALAEVDFTLMTDLRKIGFGAFTKCSALKKSSSILTYDYVKYTKDGDSGEKFTSLTNNTPITEGVIDLSRCTKLRSIGIQAFYDCTSIQYLHLPNTTNEAKNVESNLYVSVDPDDSMTFSGTKAAVSGSSTAILIGEVAKQASTNHNSNIRASTHYANDVFATNPRYYHVTESSDIIDNVGSEHYWTRYNNQYILFDTEAAAKWFFSKGHTPDAVQFPGT